MDGVRLVTDPLLRRRIGPLHSVGPPATRRRGDSDVASVDAVLLSHLHRDHTDLPIDRPVRRAHAFRRPGRRRPRSYGAGARPGGPSSPWARRCRSEPVQVEATLAVHDGRRTFGGDTAEAVGYLVRGSRTVYFAGDTDVFDGMGTLGGGAAGPARRRAPAGERLGAHARARAHGRRPRGRGPRAATTADRPSRSTGAPFALPLVWRARPTAQHRRPARIRRLAPRRPRRTRASSSPSPAGPSPCRRHGTHGADKRAMPEQLAADPRRSGGRGSACGPCGASSPSGSSPRRRCCSSPGPCPASTSTGSGRRSPPPRCSPRSTGWSGRCSCGWLSRSPC